MLVLQPHGRALALVRLLEWTLDHGIELCPGWPIAARVDLLRRLADVAWWLQSMLVAQAHESC